MGMFILTFLKQKYIITKELGKISIMKMRVRKIIVAFLMIIAFNNLSAQWSVSQGIGVSMIDNVDPGVTMDMGVQYHKGILYGELFANYMGGNEGDNPLIKNGRWTKSISDGYTFVDDNPYSGKNVDALGVGICVGLAKTFNKFRPYAAIGTHYGRFRSDFVQTNSDQGDKIFIDFGQEINNVFGLSASFGFEVIINPKWALGIKARVMDHLSYNTGIMINSTYYL